MATSEGIPSSIDIEFLELNDNPYCINMAHGQAQCYDCLKKHRSERTSGVNQSQDASCKGLKSLQNARKLFYGHLYI